MAKKDYVSAGRRRRKTRQPDPGRVLLMGITLLASALLGFAGGYWMDKPRPIPDAAQKRDESSQLLARIEQLQREIRTMKEKSGRQQKDEKEADTDVGELTFYHELPEQSVSPTPVADIPVQTFPEKPAGISETRMTKKNRSGKASPEIKEKKPDSGRKGFRIQVASLGSASAAARLQKQLNDWGLSAFVKKVQVRGHGWRYRVYAGPYRSRSSAEDANLLIAKKLSKMGIVLGGE